MSTLRNQIKSLSTTEKDELLDAVWESLDADALSLTETQYADLDYPITRHKKDPSDVIPWERVRAGLHSTRLARWVLLAAAASVFFLTSSPAETCAPPPGFVDTQHPDIAPDRELVAHTEEITIDRPFAAVLDVVNKPIKNTIKKSGSLPTFSGEYALTNTGFGTAGSRRIACLSDGSSLEQEVLQRERDNTSSRFRYIVWKYTTAKARPIAYGVADFHYTDMGGGRTHIKWIYSFKLKDHEYPGSMGAFGRFLFRKYFLERDYADLMRGVLQGYKSDAEQPPASKN